MKRVLRGLYSGALRAYPRRFRERHAESLLELVETMLREAAGLGATVRLAGRLLVDLAKSLGREWWLQLAPQRASGALVGRWRLEDRAQRRRPRLAVFSWRSLARPLLRRPGAAAAVVITLALGIGVNVALYSVLRAVVLAPLPFAEEARVVRVWPGRSFSKQLLTLFREEARSYDGVAAYSGWLLTLTSEGRASELDAMAVSGNFFSLLRVPAAFGRTLLPEDGLPGAEPVVVLSDALWRERFGADPGVVGSTIELGETSEIENGRPVMDRRRVVGVLSAGYGGLRRGTELWFPLTLDPADERDFEGSWYLTAIGRLRAEVDAAAATAELRAISRRWKEGDFTHFEEEEVSTARVESLREWMVADVRLPLLLLLGAVFLVLCIAGLNVANLELARTVRRREELMVRSALGASRRRLVAARLGESAMLALLGAGLGLGIAWLLQHSLASWLTTVLPRADEIALGPQAVVFAVACALFASLLAAAPSAWTVARDDFAGLRTSRGPGGLRLRHALVLGEVAASLVLLLCSGLLIKSFWGLLAVDPGFDADGVTVLRISPSSPRYSEPEHWSTLGEHLIERLQAVPGVERAGAIHLLPLTLGNWSFPYQAEGHPVPPETPPPVANYRVVAGDYFQSLKVPLLAGRLLGPADRADAEPVVVVNRTLAERWWGLEEAVDKRLDLFLNLPHRVVGVVGDVRQHRLDLEVQPEMYFPLPQQQATGFLHLLVRSEEPPQRLVPALREAVRSVDPLIPVGEVLTLREAVGRSVQEMRFAALLVGAFGALALGLSLLGIYGVLSTAIEGRWRELGIRLALGARRTSVEREGVRESLPWILSGVLVGLGGGLLAGRALERFLFEVEPHDPAVLAAATLVLLVTAAVACWLPARRASRLDPSTVLRAE